MGRPKQLIPVAGKTLLQRTVNKVAQADVSEIVVVLGAEWSAICQALQWPQPSLTEAVVGEIGQENNKPCRVVVNHAWASGLSSSLQTGLRALQLSDNPPEAILFVLGDLPFLETESINATILAFRRAKADHPGSFSMVAPVFGGRRGHPVIIGQEWFTELNRLQGDCGAGRVLKANAEQLLLVEVDNSGIFEDCDTPEQAALLSERCSNSSQLNH